MTVLLLSLTAAGCISYSSFQSPRVLDPGQAEIGAGVTVTSTAAIIPPSDSVDPILLPFPEISAHGGVGRGFEVGFRIAGIPPIGALQLDGRYQLLDGAFPVAMGLGLAFGGGSSDDSASIQVDAPTFFGAYPSLMFGSDRVYGGLRAVFWSMSDSTGTSSHGLLGVVMGASLGGSYRIIPEINGYLTPGGPVFGLGVAVKRRSGGDGDEGG